MANLDQICDYLADNQLYYKDVSMTVTTSYQSWYYADAALNLPFGSNIMGHYVLVSGSNRPAFSLIIENGAKVRAYCNVTNTPITIRVLYR